MYHPWISSESSWRKTSTVLLPPATESATVRVLQHNIRTPGPCWTRVCNYGDKFSPSNVAGTFFEVLTEFSLSQCVDCPTCFFFLMVVLNKSGLDLSATTRPDLVNLVSISDPASDHCLVSTYMGLSAPVHDRGRKKRFLGSDPWLCSFRLGRPPFSSVVGSSSWGNAGHEGRWCSMGCLVQRFYNNSSLFRTMRLTMDPQK